MSKHKILIVEDDFDCRELFKFYFRQSGYETIEAATGLEAISLARVTHPDLILMDLGIPSMTGDEATARLKADPSTRDIPVIVTTAFSYGPLLELAISAGAEEIMHKPLELKTLRLAMQRLISLNSQPDGISNDKKTKEETYRMGIGPAARLSKEA